jgi:hypothetical protein
MTGYADLCGMKIYGTYQVKVNPGRISGYPMNTKAHNSPTGKIQSQ